MENHTGSLRRVGNKKNNGLPIMEVGTVLDRRMGPVHQRVQDLVTTNIKSVYRRVQKY